MVIYDPFTTPILLETIEDHDLIQKLKNICLEQNNKYENLTDGLWQTYNFLDWDYPEIKKLETIFADYVRKYQNEIIKKNYNFSLNGWINLRKEQSSHGPHGHPNTDLIINFYLNTPKNSFLNLYNPVSATLINQWGNTIHKHEIEVKEGMIIIMPAWFLHEVPPTLEKNFYRISMSCNVRFL